MKRGGFLKRKTPLKAHTPLRAKTPLKSRVGLKSTQPRKRTKKRSTALPSFLQGIPAGSHGSTPIQKKAWTYISRMVRKEEFETWGGVCVSCNHRFTSWEEGQAGHYISWAKCNGIFKYNTQNLGLQCATCNANFQKNNALGYRFGMTLNARYGEGTTERLEEANNKLHGSSMRDQDVIDLLTFYHEKYSSPL